ncbi:MAG: HAD family hydrolase [Clostridiales bacterium]|nr:HAD family hydrolase [Clostridiales bacterium]
MRAFIFDMDGVIIDSEPLHFESDKMVMREFGVELTDEELNRYVGVANPQMWIELKDKYSIDLSVDELIEMQHMNKLKLLEDNQLETIRGIDELITDLQRKGIAVALASSSNMEFIQLVLKKLGITECFQVIVSGDDVEKGKPEPDIFLKAAELLKVRPQDCIVLEDSAHGVNAAKRAGMKCIGFINPNSGNQDLSKADKIVSTLEGLEYDCLYEDKEK